MFLQILEALLPKGIIVPSAFETVGHIVHLNLKEEHLPYKNLIAKVLFLEKKEMRSEFTVTSQKKAVFVSRLFWTKISQR